jgi:hypothetical protein
MTETAWLACTDPYPMLGALRGRASDRKLRLFGLACCVRGKLLGEASPLLDLIEAYADDLIGSEELWQVFNLLPDSEARRVAVPRAFDLDEARWFSAWTAWATARPTGLLPPARPWYQHQGTDDPGRETSAEEAAELTVQCSFLRDLFNGPSEVVALSAAWLTADVSAIAEGVYRERILPARTLDVSRLAVLGDALEEAGCTNRTLLVHCRSSGPHIRGCWAVDAVLDRSSTGDAVLDRR